jgi:hypothetical protein
MYLRNLNNYSFLPCEIAIKENKARFYFNYALFNTDIMYNDKDFNTFLRKKIFSILTDETIIIIMNECQSKDVFYQSFYFIYLLDNHYLSFEYAMKYLNTLKYNDHYNVLDSFLNFY